MNVGSFINNGIYSGNDWLSYYVEKVNLRPSTVQTEPGQNMEFYAEISAEGQVPQAQWQVENASSADTTIITTGEDNTAILAIGADETAQTLTVTVSCAGVSDTASVAVGQAGIVDTGGTASGNTVTPLEDPDKTANAAILNHSITAIWKNKNTGLRLNWAPVAEANGYDIFVTKSKKVSFGKKAAATVTGGDSTSAVIKKLNNKKLNTKKNYKIKIKAYRIVDGQKQYIGTSMAFHVAGRNSAYTNAKNIRLAAKKITLKKGRKSKIQATVVRQNNKKALLPKRYVANLRYESSNTKVAAVTKNGKIKAKNRGTCTITITAANGVRKQVKVKVR